VTSWGTVSFTRRIQLARTCQCIAAPHSLRSPWPCAYHCSENVFCCRYNCCTATKQTWVCVTIAVCAVNISPHNRGWRRNNTTVLRLITPRYTHPVRTAQRTQSVTTIKTNRRMFYEETVAGHCENRAKRIRTLCRHFVTDSSHWFEMAGWNIQR
jgi:hypothetical protein